MLIDGETIAAVGAPDSSRRPRRPPRQVIDATGKYVIPGGIDVHTHMELPFGGTFASDTFETGTIAAAWGGVTTIVDMAVQRTGESVQEGLADWHRKADGNCAIDYGFHQIIGGVDDESLKAMRYLTEHEGVTSFKLFMAYPGVFYSDDGQILRAMQTAGECGAMIMMHAENGIAIDVLVAQALARGETDPRYHADTRPSDLEAEATHRAIVLAKVAGNVPLYVVHMSAGDALERDRRGPPRRPQRLRRDLPAVPVAHARGDAAAARLRGGEVGLLDAAALAERRAPPPGEPVEGPAHERARGRVDRPLPVLLQGPEGARARRLLEDPERHRRRRAPHGAALPGRRRPASSPRTMGRDVLHHAGAHVRDVPAQGHRRARRGRRRRRVGPQRADADRRRTTSIT